MKQILVVGQISKHWISFFFKSRQTDFFFHHNSQQANNCIGVDSEGHEDGDDDIEDVVHDADVDEDDEDLFFH